MKTLKSNRSLPYFLSELAYTEAGLKASPEASDLAPACTMLLKGWYSLFQKESESRLEVTRAGAVVKMKSQALDMALRRFSGRVLVEANQNRESLFFRTFFPKAPSSFVNRALSKQVDFVINKLVPEIEKLEDDHPLRPFAESLQTVAEEAQEAERVRSRAQGAQISISREVEGWKMGVNAFRMSAFGELFKVASDIGYPRSWAESFFRTETVSRGEVAEDEQVDDVPEEDTYLPEASSESEQAPAVAA